MKLVLAVLILGWMCCSCGEKKNDDSTVTPGGHREEYADSTRLDPEDGSDDAEDQQEGEPASSPDDADESEEPSRE